MLKGVNTYDKYIELIFNIDLKVKIFTLWSQMLSRNYANKVRLQFTANAEMTRFTFKLLFCRF